LANEYVRGLKDAPADPVRAKVQFKYGAIVEISVRLDTMTKERDALTSSGGTSLVIVKKKGVESKYGKVKYRGTRAVAVSSEQDAAARRQGHVKGASVEITPVVKG